MSSSSWSVLFVSTLCACSDPSSVVQDSSNSDDEAPASGEDDSECEGENTCPDDAAQEDAEDAELYVEIQVSDHPDLIDFEFDWGRDGVHCSECNEGDGNSRLVFTDREQHLWLGYVDPETGAFDPADGRGQLLDNGAAFATDFGNGPEWMVSSGSSAIVYTKYQPGVEQSTFSAAVAFATANPDGDWRVGIMTGGSRRQSPAATLDLDDPNPRVNYQDWGKRNVYWVDATDPWNPGPPTLLPIGEQTGGGSRRWVPGTKSVIFSGAAAPDENGDVYQQVFIYDTDADVLEQLTFDPVTKWGVFMWRAPEFDDDYVFFTVANRSQIRIYRQLPETAPEWTAINTIDTPTEIPYVWSPEPFVYNGRSYIHMQLSSNRAANDLSVPTQLALTNIEPGDARLRMLTNDRSIRRVRMDPEHFITEEGAFIYYNRYIPASEEENRPVINDGVWRVDTRLGPPTQ